MIYVHFTFDKKDIKRLIDHSVKDNAAKQILQTDFNKLLKNQRTDYILATSYGRSEDRNSQRNGYYYGQLTTRVGTLELKVPRTGDGEFSPTVFERY